MLTQHDVTVLLISDDPELGGVVAMNLRLRGYAVEHTNLNLAIAPRWNPSASHLDLVIVHIEAADGFAPIDLKKLVERQWAKAVPILLTSENPDHFGEVLAGRISTVLTRPDDVGAILGATRAMLDPAAVPSESPLASPIGESK